MATITKSGNYLVINENGVNTLTIPTGKLTLRIDGNNLAMDHDGKFRTSLLYSDVTSPSAANAEALRVAVISLINT